MCGIFGYTGNKNTAPEIVLSGLKTLEYRGYDSWGVAVGSTKYEAGSKKSENNKIIVKKRVGKIGDATVSDLPPGTMAFGHTRWATHGGVTEINAHPHIDCSKRLAIIHNGIIENYEEIKKELLSSGHTFISETDTEVAVHLVEENVKKLRVENPKLQTKDVLFEAVRKAFNRFDGLNAIIVMDSTSGTFVAAKNGSPLVIGKGNGENLFASDAHPILSFTKQMYFLEDGDMATISKDDISIFEAQSGKKKVMKFVIVDWITALDADKGSHRHFMYKEIVDQIKVIENIIQVSDEQVDMFMKLIKSSFGTYFVGCGTAAYACLAGTYIFSKIAKRHVNFSVGSEFGYLVDFLTPKSLVVALSQSGETIDVIDAVKKAREKGAVIATLVNVLGSTLYRFANHKLLLGAGVEKAVVSTKACTSKLSYLILLAHALSGKKEKGKELLRRSVSELSALLGGNTLEKIKDLASVLKAKEHIYVVGRGMSYPIALESALKIKEASYIHAEGFAAGELKHGVIALIENGTPCIVFLPNDETYGATLAGAMEMKARGASIIGISHKPHAVFDTFIPVADCGVGTAIPAVAVGQLLGYFLAVSRGIDPDKPRNLAKSVTVR